MADTVLELDLPPPPPPVTRLRRERFIRALRSDTKRQREIERYLVRYRTDREQMDLRLRMGANIARAAEGWTVGQLNVTIVEFLKLKNKRLALNAASLANLDRMRAAVENLYFRQPNDLLATMEMHRLVLKIDTGTVEALGHRLIEIMLEKLQQPWLLEEPAGQRLVLTYTDLVLNSAILAAITTLRESDAQWHKQFRKQVGTTEARLDRLKEAMSDSRG